MFSIPYGQVVMVYKFKIGGIHRGGSFDKVFGSLRLIVNIGVIKVFCAVPLPL